VGGIPRYGRYVNGLAEFPVQIAIDDMTLPVREGMGATISIPMGARENVLTVPAAAVEYGPDGSAVLVVEGDQVERRLIRVGVGDGITVEVLEGLQEGDTVRMRLVGNQVSGAPMVSY
jgi:multidrug efflux pump subunit AcrA (membrane-fusion protein)